MPETVTYHTRPDRFDGVMIEKIERYFGEGSGNVAWSAIRRKGFGTVLVDGGGQVVALPHAEQVKIARGRFEDATCTTRVPVLVKKCKQCGSDLKPHTTKHHMSDRPAAENHPKTVDDCQRLSNEPVIAIHGYASNSRSDWWPFVSWFETWDGESYDDPDFCRDYCAAEYGRRAVQQLPLLDADGSKAIRYRKSHESVDHYEREVRYINGIKV